MADGCGFLREMGIMRMLVACMVESEASGGTVQTLELRRLGNLGGAAGLADMDWSSGATGYHEDAAVELPWLP